MLQHKIRRSGNKAPVEVNSSRSASEEAGALCPILVMASPPKKGSNLAQIFKPFELEGNRKGATANLFPRDANTINHVPCFLSVRQQNPNQQLRPPTFRTRETAGNMYNIQVV